MIADVMTLETTYNFQWDNGDGTWSWYSQVEYTTEQAARDYAKSCFGGELPFRIIKIERHVIEN